MIPVIATVGTQTLSAVLVVSYAATGALVAGWLDKQGQSRATSLGALLAWPLLLPLLSGPVRPAGRGPLAEEIDACLAALHRTLADPAAQDLQVDTDLEGLQDALRAADARLALVDRVLSDAPAGLAAGEVRAARAAGEKAVRGVIDEVHQLRLQVGMAAMAGGHELLAQRLADVAARAATLSELRGEGMRPRR